MIICVGRNYKKHAAELGNEVPKEPVLFLKADNSLRGFNDFGQLAKVQAPIHYEAEIVLEIKEDIELEAQGSLEQISSIRAGLDLTLRKKQSELKEKGLPWLRAKSFYGSAIISKPLDFKKINNPHSICFSFSLNGEVKQKGNSKDMLFTFEEILTEILKTHPLKKGDLIFTGTPEGVGEIRPGDTFDFEFEDLKETFSGKL